MASPAILILENEEPFHGTAMGHEGLARGVIVSSTLTAGFPDLLTDPSYSGKLVCFTYPHVGNAGLVPGELQSDRVAARAVVAREFSRFKANRLGVETMDVFLKKNAVPAIEGIDTRRVTDIIRRRGLIRAVLGCGAYADVDALAAEFAKPDDAWRSDFPGADAPYEFKDGATASQRRSVVVYDLGVKRGFLRRLTELGCRVTVVPAVFPVEKAMESKPDGIVFSAGPGLPEQRPEALALAGALLGKIPLWGVGVGAGILAVAAGAKAVANGRGHFGVQPVGRPGGPSGEMTSQCHEFWIEGESLPGAGLAPTHIHLNDGTVEGFKCDDRRVMGTLFHPEAEPGPRDSLYLFDRFYELMGK